MLIWARALVYARAHGHTPVWPAWGQVHLGSWLRWERDKRMYGLLFRRLRHYASGSGLRRLPHYSESETAQFEARTDGDAVLRFEGIGPGFQPLVGHSEFLWKELCGIARDDLVAHRESAREIIGFGIRLGDFMKLGWSTPVPWFEARLLELRRFCPEQRVWLFSDGSDEELSLLLSDPLVSRTPVHRDPLRSPALTEIAQMSGTRLLVLTPGSTFHQWGAFLGCRPVLGKVTNDWYRQRLQMVSPCVVCPESDDPISVSQWERLFSWC